MVEIMEDNIFCCGREWAVSAELKHGKSHNYTIMAADGTWRSDVTTVEIQTWEQILMDAKNTIEGRFA